MTHGFSRFKVSDYLNNLKVVSEYIKALEEEIEAQAKRIAELEAALKPFANVTPVLQEDDHGVIYEWALNCDDIHQARKVLGDKSD